MSHGLVGSIKRLTTRAQRRRLERAWHKRFTELRFEGLEHRLMLANDVLDLLVADPADDRIQRLAGDTGELIDTFISGGPGSDSGLIDPLDPTFGPDGNLYVISNDPGAEKILRFDGTDGSFIDDFV
jgi:hypothetical protein